MFFLKKVSYLNKIDAVVGDFSFFSTAIDGGYSGWKETAKCSATCGGGKKTLTRTCTSPPPSNGGKDCSRLGPAMKEVSCDEQECRKLTLSHQLPYIFSLTNLMFLDPRGILRENQLKSIHVHTFCCLRTFLVLTSTCL